MPGGPYLIDTNILLRCLQPTDPDYSVAASALELLVGQGATPCYLSQNLAEFWSACTRPADRNGYGLSLLETDRRARILEARLRLLPDSLSIHQEWRRLIVAHRVSGAQVYDARLAAAMHVHGVRRILTFNDRDFARYDGIEAVNPLTVR
jgi:predicted nucleic acid-binding protein